MHLTADLFVDDGSPSDIGSSLRYVGTLHLYINRLEEAERLQQTGMQYPLFYLT